MIEYHKRKHRFNTILLEITERILWDKCNSKHNCQCANKREIMRYIWETLRSVKTNLESKLALRQYVKLLKYHDKSSSASTRIIENLLKRLKVSGDQYNWLKHQSISALRRIPDFCKKRKKKKVKCYQINI